MLLVFNSQITTLPTKRHSELICQHWSPSARRPRLPPRLCYFFAEFVLCVNFNNVILELLSVEDEQNPECFLRDVENMQESAPVEYAVLLASNICLSHQNIPPCWAGSLMTPRKEAQNKCNAKKRTNRSPLCVIIPAKMTGKPFPTDSTSVKVQKN